MGQQSSSIPPPSNSNNHTSTTNENPTFRRRTLFSTFINRRNRSATTTASSSRGAIASSSNSASYSGSSDHHQQQPPRRKTILQRIIKRNDDSDDSDEEEEIDERVFSLPMEFIQYRRGWYERHEEYAQQFDQSHSTLLSHELGLINSDIIPIILSFLSIRDCCNFSASCKLVYHYWLGDPWFWFRISPKRLVLHVQKYQPFSLEFINAKNWRDMAMIFIFNKTWRSIDSCFEVCEKSYSSSNIPKEESFFYFKNPDDENVVKQLLFGTEGKPINVKCKRNNAKYLVNFGISMDDYKPEHGSNTQCVMFINLYTSNGSREMLCLEKFTKQYGRHDFLIVVYYWPNSTEQEKGFSFNTQLNSWRAQSELNITPYLEYLEPIRSDKEAKSFFQLVLKWKALKHYLKHANHSPQDKHRGTLESMVLSYCSDYMD